MMFKKAILVLVLVGLAFGAQAQTVDKWYTNELEVGDLPVFPGVTQTATAKIADYTILSPTDDFKHFTNSGIVSSASEVTLTLPTAAAGLCYSFGVVKAATFEVDPGSGDQILVLTNSTEDKIQATEAGAFVHLFAVDATNWIVIKKEGTWSDED